MPIQYIPPIPPIHPSHRDFMFHSDFTSTWRLTPASLEIVNDILNTHPEVPFIVKMLIRTLGIPDLHMKVGDDSKARDLKITSGIGPIQKTQTIHFGSIEWKGLYNNYTLHVQMDTGLSRRFRISGSIPGRGFSEFEYSLNDNGKILSINVSVPMKEGEAPFKCSLLFYSIDKANDTIFDEEAGFVKRRYFIFNNQSTDSQSELENTRVSTITNLSRLD